MKRRFERLELRESPQVSVNPQLIVGLGDVVGCATTNGTVIEGEGADAVGDRFNPRGPVNPQLTNCKVGQNPMQTANYLTNILWEAELNGATFGGSIAAYSNFAMAAGNVLANPGPPGWTDIYVHGEATCMFSGKIDYDGVSGFSGDQLNGWDMFPVKTHFSITPISNYQMGEDFGSLESSGVVGQSGAMFNMDPC